MSISRFINQPVRRFHFELEVRLFNLSRENRKFIAESYEENIFDKSKYFFRLKQFDEHILCIYIRIVY